MGTMSGGDGGGWPPDELPELPPEWGTIVIPDDASELAQEATKVRRELRRQVRQRRWRRWLHLPPPGPRDNDEEATTLGVPLLVISIAVIATLTSLFAIAWPTRQLRPDLRPTAVASTPVAGTPGSSAPAGTATAAPTGPATTAPTGTDTPRALGVPDVSLIDPDGGTLRLRGALPAVVLLVDGCDCSQLVTATAVAAAVVLPRGNGYAVSEITARTDTAAADHMTWDVTDLGFRMGLSPRVPDVLAEHVGPVVTELLDRHGLAVSDIDGWAVHPGGPKILDVVRDSLGLPEERIAPSRDTLARHGNCSSPTVLLIMDALRRQPVPPRTVVMLAFGPGLTLYATLLSVN